MQERNDICWKIIKKIYSVSDSEYVGKARVNKGMDYKIKKQAIIFSSYN